MRHLSLCTGVGGIDLAGEMAGMISVAFCEKEEFPQKVLQKHWPHVPIYDDLKTLTKARLDADGIRSIDIISGGIPCQPFSHAGKRGGTNDDRHLWPEMLRVVEEVRPTWALIENVAGILSMEQSDSELIMETETTIRQEAEMVVETIRRDFKEIGYESITIVIPACAIGSTNKRDRVFIVANTNSIGNGSLEEIRTNGIGATENNWREKSQFGSSDSSQILADTQGKRFRKKRIDRSNRTAKRITCRRKILANCPSEGLERITRSSLHRDINRPASCGENVARPECFRQSEQRKSFPSIDQKENGSRQATRIIDGSIRPERTIESRLGRMPNGLSSWLDGSGINLLEDLHEFIHNFAWPAAMGQPQHEWEPPRVATGIKNRAARLKAIGNAVNPIQIFPLLYAIKQIHDSLTDK